MDQKHQLDEMPEPADTNELGQNSEQDDDDEYELVGPSLLERAWQKLRLHKRLAVTALVVIVVLIIGVVPKFRYAVLGLFVRTSYTIEVIDGTSHLPVSEATVSWQGKSATTDANGKLHLPALRLGTQPLVITKSYYETYNQPTTVGLRDTQLTITFTPNGSWVPVLVLDQSSQKPVANAVLTVAETKVRTNERGEATIVLPDSGGTTAGLITADGYLTTEVSVTVSHLAIRDNTFYITRK